MATFLAALRPSSRRGLARHVLCHRTMRRPYQLLVVDYDLAMREMLASLFRERGFWVQEADSAGTLPRIPGPGRPEKKSSLPR